MTQVGTISASMAALNIEQMRIPRRISTKSKVADASRDAELASLRQDGTADPEAIDQMIPAAALSMDLLDAGDLPRQPPTFRQAEDAYRAVEE